MDDLLTLDRVQAALVGALDPSELTQDEWRIFDDLQFQSIAESSEEAQRAYKEIGMRPGAVGTDELDRIVRRRSDGSLEILDGGASDAE